MAAAQNTVTPLAARVRVVVRLALDVGPRAGVATPSNDSAAGGVASRRHGVGACLRRTVAARKRDVDEGTAPNTANVAPLGTRHLAGYVAAARQPHRLDERAAWSARFEASERTRMHPGNARAGARFGAARQRAEMFSVVGVAVARTGMPTRQPGLARQTTSSLRCGNVKVAGDADFSNDSCVVRARQTN